MQHPPHILAIDTSCDDTSAAVTAGVTVLSNIVASQTQLHKPYGGVFPTVAKQAHRENIDRTISLALERARVDWNEIDAVAVTQGPGLAPALEVGIITAKQLVADHQLPLIAVNHIEAHALSALAERRHKAPQPEIISWGTAIDQHQFPALAIVVSGGHTEFILVSQIGMYKRLGQTIDDAAGEALDKVGRMLGLGYPAGPIMEQFAKRGNIERFDVPLPMTDHQDFDLSFSGLKTWARNKIEEIETSFGLDKQTTYDFAASFQNGVFRHICYKLNKLLEAQSAGDNFREVWLGGGVAANIELRRMIRKTLSEFVRTQRQQITEQYPNIPLLTPFNKRLCMDNAAMIGIVAEHKFLAGEFTKDIQRLDRKPRWEVGS